MTRVLSVSLDIELGELREMILSSAGFSVTTVYSFDAAIDSLLLKPDIFMVGHTLSASQSDALISKCRDVSPRTTVLLMSKTGFSDCKVKPDHLFDIYEGPEALVRTFQAIADGVNRAAGAK